MTGTTDLATLAQQLPAHLRGAKSAALDEFAAGLGKGIPLPFLSIRGKEFRLRKDGQELNTRQRELSVIFIAARHSKSKRYYKDKYVSGSLEAPDCSSRDGVTPDVAEPIHPNCTHCPMNQWGSRQSEAGKDAKACSDYKRIVIWPTGMTEEPLVLDVAATSLKAPKGQKHTVLMLGDYLAQLAKHGMDPTQVVTKIAFTDAEYPQLCFNFERFVTEAEWARVQEFRASDDVNTCIDANLFEEGEAKPDPADAAPVPPKAEPPVTDTPITDTPKVEPEVPAFPGVATIMTDGDNLIIAQDAMQWEEAWRVGFRPQATGQLKKDKPAEEVKEEAAPEEAKAAAPDSNDLLAEVAALLGRK